MTEAPDKSPAKRAGQAIPFRALAIALAIPIAGIAAVVAVRGPGGEDSRFTVSDGREAKGKQTRDPFAVELARCRTVAADTVDERCRAAWDLNRRRFFGSEPSAILPEPDPQIPSAAPAGEER